MNPKCFSVNHEYDRKILEKILILFDYADKLKQFHPKFLRFDFGKLWTQKHVCDFFKQAVQWHQKRNRKFLYFCIAEQKKGSVNLHYHAFCIVNSKNYKTRRSVISMLSERSKFILDSNPELGKLWIPTKKRINFPSDLQKYNFYSISTDIKANSKEREEAIRAASYLAKKSQIPDKDWIQGLGRRIFKSKIAKLSKEEIRLGYTKINITDIITKIHFIIHK